MKYKKILCSFIVLFMFGCMAFGAENENTETFIKDGSHYAVKTYEIESENEKLNTDFIGDSFELEGYMYHQYSIETEPIVEKINKEVNEKASVSVSAQNTNAVIKAIGETKEYSDDEGYKGIMNLDTGSITYNVSGYQSKSYTKNENKMYYNLPDMDTSRIDKVLWSDGIQLNLYDISWIGDNNNSSGNTAVGNNFAAKAFYSGTYSVKIPMGYTALAVFKGTAEKEISDKTAVKITYIGEKIPEAPVDATKSHIKINPFMVGFGVFDILLLGSGIYLFTRFRKKKEETENDEVIEGDKD